MKIILEFPNLKDLTVELPKFAAILNPPTDVDDFVKIATDAEEEKDHHLIIGKRGEAAEPEQKPEESKKTSSKKAHSVEEKPAEAGAKNDTTPPWEGSGSGAVPSITNVRSAFNDLIKNNRRDAVKVILAGFKATNLSGLSESNYGAAIEAAKKYLAMPDKDYEEAIKK